MHPMYTCLQRDGLMEGGGGLLWVETPQERDDWHRMMRKHSAHHRIENVFVLSPGAIGTGAYSRVLGATDKTFPVVDQWLPVALKVLEKSAMNEDDVAAFKSEISVLGTVKTLRAPFCLEMLEWFECRTQFIIVMPYMAGGELYARLKANGEPSFPEIEIQALAKQLLTALEFLHRHGICHKDIKPENILLSHVHRSRPYPVECRIADFGIAAQIDPSNRMTCFHDRGALRCSPGYGAPEVVRQHADGSNTYGQPVDMWSLGVTLYIMLSGVQPFVGDTELETRQKMINGSVSLEPVAKHASAHAVNLLSKMLVVDPAARVSAKEALQHPWITEIVDASGEARAVKPTFWFKDKRIVRRFAFLKILWASLVVSCLLVVLNVPGRLTVHLHLLGFLSVVAVFLRKDPNFQYFEFRQVFDGELAAKAEGGRGKRV